MVKNKNKNPAVETIIYGSKDYDYAGLKGKLTIISEHCIICLLK